MGLEGAAGLYRLNVSVGKVILLNQCPQRRKSVCLQACFWGLPVMNIYPAHLFNEYDEMTEPNLFKNFENGTTGYFHSEPIELIRSIQRHPILIKIFQNLDGADTLHAIGTSAVKVTEKFSELISRSATCARKHGISGTIDGVYNVMDKNNIQVGTISLQVQLICYDNSLLKTPLTLLAEHCNPLRDGLSKYLLPQKTSEGYVLIPSDVVECNFDGLLSGCHGLMDNKYCEVFRKDVICSEMVSKGAVIASPIEITNLARDGSISESVMGGDHRDELLLCRNLPTTKDEQREISDSLSDEVSSFAVEQPPKKHLVEFELRRDVAMARKLSIETYTSDNEAALDNTQCLKSPSVGRQSSNENASQEQILLEGKKNVNFIEICEDRDYMERIRHCIAACPGQDETSEDQIPSKKTPRKPEIIPMDESIKLDSQQEHYSVYREFAERKNDQVKTTSTSSSTCSENQNTLSQSSESSLKQVKASSRTPTPSQCITVADDRATIQNQFCTSLDSSVQDKPKPNINHVKKADSSTQILLLCTRNELVEVHSPQQISHSKTTTSDEFYKNEQFAVKSCVWDEAFGTQHSHRPQDVETCSTNAPPVRQSSSPLSCLSDGVTKITTRPSLHRQDCLSAEALENQPLDCYHPSSENDASNKPFQYSKNHCKQVQDKEEQYYDCSKNFIDKDDEECSNPFLLCHGKRNEKPSSGNGTLDQSSSQQCLSIKQKYPEGNCMDNIYYNSLRTQHLLHGYRAPIADRDLSSLSSNKTNDYSDVGSNVADATRQYQRIPLTSLEPLQVAAGCCCVGNYNYMCSTGEQKLIEGNCTLIKELDSEQFTQDREEEDSHARLNAIGNMSPYQSTLKTFPQFGTEEVENHRNNTCYYSAAMQHLVQNYRATIADFTPKIVSLSNEVAGLNFAARAADETSQYPSRIENFLQITKKHSSTGNENCENSSESQNPEPRCHTLQADIDRGLSGKKAAKTGIQQESESVSQHRLHVNGLSISNAVAIEDGSEKRHCHVYAEEQQPTQRQSCNKISDLYSTSQRSLSPERNLKCSDYSDNLSSAEKEHENTENASRKPSPSIDVEVKQSTEGVLPNQPGENRLSSKRTSFEQIAVDIQSYKNVHDCGVSLKRDITEERSMDAGSPLNNYSRSNSICYEVCVTAPHSEDTAFQKCSYQSQQDLPTVYLENVENHQKSCNLLAISDTCLSHRKDSLADDSCQMFQSESSTALFRQPDNSGARGTPYGNVFRRGSDVTKPKDQDSSATTVSTTRICKAAAESSKYRGAQRQMHSHHSGHHHYYSYRKTDPPRGSWVSNVSMNSSRADSCICMNNRCVWLNCRTS